MNDLIYSYHNTLRDVQKAYESYTARINAFKDDSTYPDRERAHEAIQRLKAERSHVSRMINDLEFCIEWMTTARMPGNKRGIERRSYQQREVYKDASWWNKYAMAQQGHQVVISDEKLKQLDDLLSCLTQEQREVYILVRGRSFTFRECGNLLAMSSSNVNYHIKNAEERIRRKLAGEEVVPTRKPREPKKKEEQKSLSMYFDAAFEEEPKPIKHVLMHEPDVLDYLQIDKKVLQKWMKKEQLPFRKVGRKLFFWKHELENWFEKRNSTQ